MDLSLDPTSLSNTHEISVKFIHLSLTVDFSRKVLSGFVDHHVQVLKEGVTKVILDSENLNVKNVYAVNGESLEKLKFQIGETRGVYGQPLEITFSPSIVPSDSGIFVVRIEYETSPDASSLLWMEPNQTAGKKHPYMFSGNQFIHGRSLLPCQDTNIAKVTFTASLTVPQPLTALMGATSSGHTTNGDQTTFNFVQTIPINSYLIAIAIGHLESREIGPKCRVWSEPEMVDKGVYEFANVEKFVKAGEDLLIPYPWGRSLENVIAHEIAHSWMGNTIGCRYWNEWYLTEGFNVFLERKLLAKVYSQELADFEAVNGLQKLEGDIKALGADSPFTCLRVKKEGYNPDELFCAVPFEKGFNFLCYLQHLVGVSRFEAWLKAYVTEFQYNSVTTDILKSHFTTYFAQEPEVLKIDWDTWIDKPGMPIFVTNFSRKFFDAAVDLAKRWYEQGNKGASANDMINFSPVQKLTFLDQLQSLTLSKPFDSSVLAALDTHYSFTKSKNAELRTRWYVLCIRANYQPILPHVTEFLAETGRTRYTRPLYSELHKNPQTKQLARDTLKTNYDSYHSVAAKMLAKDLEI